MTIMANRDGKLHGADLATHPLQMWAVTMTEKHHCIEKQFGSESQVALFDIRHRYCPDL
jgi:hypothetical protein